MKGTMRKLILRITRFSSSALIRSPRLICFVFDFCAIGALKATCGRHRQDLMAAVYTKK